MPLSKPAQPSANFVREPQPAISMRREAEGDLEIVLRETQEWIDSMKRLDTLRKTLVHALGEAQQQQVNYYNLRRRDREFNVGDLVLRRAHPISKTLSCVRYELTSLAGHCQGVVSVQDSKQYATPCDPN